MTLYKTTHGKNSVMYQNRFMLVLHGSKELAGEFAAYVNLNIFKDNSGQYICFSKGKFNPVALTMCWAILYFPFMLIAFIGGYLLSYFEGGKNFIKNGIWATNVRTFGWANIALVILLTILLILK